MLGAQALEQLEDVAEALGEHEFRVLAAFDRALDEIEQPEHVVIQAVLVEQRLGAPQLLERQREPGGRLVGVLRAPRPVEVQVGRRVVARQRLLGITPRYAGYVTWRGLAGRERLSEHTWRFFDDAFNYGLLADGHLIAYPIPVVDEAELRVADRQINWQWYWNVQDGPELDELMTDNEGIRRPVTVHHDLLQRRYLDELRARAERRLMAPFAELVSRSERPFVTVIADASTPQMVVGRCALIGDAAVTGRPHAAAGGAKAAANAWALAEALTAARGDVHEALRRWEPKQLEQGYALLAKVRRMAASLQHGGPFEPGDRANRFGLPVIA